MKTKDFLEAILPTDGVYLIVVHTDKGFRHKGFTSLTEASLFAKACDAQGLKTYHACASYKQLPYTDENGKRITRKSVNWNKAKSFWCDIDCGADKAQEGKGYATKKEGATALLSWCQKVGLPFPMIVDSGRGVHAYWVLNEDIDHVQWVTTATALKALMDKDGLLVDPSRTADFASVLRPVGTHNRKDPDNPKEVKVAMAQPKPISSTDFISKVSEMSGGLDVLGELPPWLTGEKKEVITTTTTCEYSAELGAEKCQQMAVMRDTQGDVGYDHWRGVIGIIKHCKEGIDLAYEWTTRRAETGHSNVDVDVKYNTWDSPPTTCEFFGKCNADGCEGCKHKGKITSPIVLCREEPVQEAETVEAVIESDVRQKAVEIEVPELPKGYEWTGDFIVHYCPDKDGVLEANPFSRTRFYLVERIKNEEGKFEFLARAHMPRGVVREFNIPGGLIGTGGSKLMELLGAYEVLTTNAGNANFHMHAYLKDSVTKLTENRSVTSTYTNFGWQDDGSFLLGTRLYRPDGSVVESLLSGNAGDQKSALPRPKGTLEGYAENINFIYNREGMEPLQYMICSLWAAPMVELCEPTYMGIPCAVTGAASGKGKTTAAMAALYAYGQAYPNLMFSGKDGATAKAQATFLGTLHSLPMLFDEITNMDVKRLSDLCYALSNGVENMRLRSSGGRVSFGDREMWRTQVAITGNTHIAERLATAGNTEAEAMRIFEIRIDNYDIPRLDPLAVSTALNQIEQNSGVAGETIVSYLVQNRQEAVNTLLSMYDLFSKDQRLMTEPKYRFYRNHMACTLAMAKIANKLGISGFDFDKLLKFALDAVRRIFEESEELATLPPDECLARMISDMSPKIASTLTFTVKEGEAPYVVNAPQGLVGRCIKGNSTRKDSTYNNKMLLSSNAVREWCTEHRVDVAGLSKALKGLGVLVSMNIRLTLGKDTNIASARQRCWILDLNKVEGLNESN